MIPTLQIDQNPFPVHVLELKNPKVLVWPSQAESTKGKDIIIGEERPEKKVLQNRTSRATAKVLMLGEQDKEKKTGSKPIGLTDSQIGLTGTPTSLTGSSSEFGGSSKSTNKIRPRFKDLTDKYEKEGAA